MIYEVLCIKFIRPSMNEQDGNMQRYAQLYGSEPSCETSNVQHLPQAVKAVRATRLVPASQHSYSTRRKNNSFSKIGNLFPVAKIPLLCTYCQRNCPFQMLYCSLITEDDLSYKRNASNIYSIWRINFVTFRSLRKMWFGI